MYTFEQKLNMKKVLVVVCLSLFAFGYSQEKEKITFPKNEMKGNALFLVLGAAEITYERLTDENSGLGVSVFYVNKEGFDTNFSLTPFYRSYFGKNPATGFFLEGFSLINFGKNRDETLYDPVTTSYSNIEKKYTDFALGFGVGSKWVHKKGFIFEINAGIGRNLIKGNRAEVVGRGGITLGYRF